MGVNWTCSYRKTIIFLFLICLLHLLAMFDGYMILSSFVLSFQTLEILLFMYVFFKHGCNLNSMLVVYGIDLFNPFYSRSMSLISLNLQPGGARARATIVSSLIFSICTTTFFAPHEFLLTVGLCTFYISI